MPGGSIHPAGSGPDWDQIGTRSGPDWDQMGTRSGPDWDQIWTSLGPDLDQMGTRSGSDGDQVWTRWGPGLGQIGTSSGPDWDQAWIILGPALDQIGTSCRLDWDQTLTRLAPVLDKIGIRSGPGRCCLVARWLRRLRSAVVPEMRESAAAICRLTNESSGLLAESQIVKLQSSSQAIWRPHPAAGRSSARACAGEPCINGPT